MFSTLDPLKIEETVKQLGLRIYDRFPNAGLHKICMELLAIVQVAEKRCADIGRPHIFLRIVVYITVMSIIVGLLSALFYLDISHTNLLNLNEFVEILDAGMNATVLIGAAILFLVTVESRLKRQRALKAIHELRAIAHVIDMHQLTKDPERLLGENYMMTLSSPKETLSPFELTRYLDYCSEMLSLLGKTAALYGQHLDDPVVLTSANDVETLTTGLAQKIWQKITIIHSFEKRMATITKV